MRGTQKMKLQIILSKDKVKIFRSFLDTYVGRNVSRTDADIIDVLASVGYQIREKNYIPYCKHNKRTGKK
jgi:hypothetical protein